MTSGIIYNLTNDQRKAYFRFVEEIADNALKTIGFDNDSLQRLIKNGERLQVCVNSAMNELSTSHEFEDEEEFPTDYLPGHYYPPQLPTKGHFHTNGDAVQLLSRTYRKRNKP